MNTAGFKIKWLRLGVLLGIFSWSSVVMGLMMGVLICRPGMGATANVMPGVSLVGKIQNENISESSGLAASRQRPGLFWTHNDRGSQPILFSIDRNGHSVSQHRIEAEVEDWEDLAIDDSGNLYVGDLGNNNVLRKELVVYQIKEPDPTASNSAIVPTNYWKLHFPGEPFDCESLIIDPPKGYVISKVFDDGQGVIYSFDLSVTNAAQTLSFVATLPVTSPITGSDLSADRYRLGIVCKAGAYVFLVNGDMTSAGQATFHRTKVKKGQIEACSFVPEGLLATEEGGDIFLFTDPAYRPTP